MIEGGRAQAEVQAAVLVAQKIPRGMQRVREEIEELCGMEVMAKAAFYRFPQGTKTVEGPTIKLALELVRIWGNTQVNVSEMARTDTQSEILAWAWDMQKNYRSARSIIVERKSDRKEGGPVVLTDMRAITTNNTSQGSRQLRETIWTILPLWVTELAVAVCKRTLVDGGGRPLGERRAEIVRFFMDKLGIREEQLVAKLNGRPVDRWDGIDLASLEVSYKSVRAGEVTKEEEFPPVVVSTAAINSAVTAAAAEANNTDTAATEPEATVESPAGEKPSPEPVEVVIPSDRVELERLLFDLFLEAGIGATPPERQHRLRIITEYLELPKPVGNVAALPDRQVLQVVQWLLDLRRDSKLTDLAGTSIAEDPPAPDER